jgi:fluoroquinolone transport system ATP-binding protein
MIRVRDLRYRYPGAEAAALDGLDLEVDAGEIFGLVGPSGAGKSTTQKVLSGLLDGYEGNVTAFGREVNDWGPEYYEHIGVSSESPNHYPKLTGAENLELFASLHRETRDPMELLDRVGLADAAGRRVSGYSKGMRMRLNFVRALLHDPELLLLDEPTSGIDPATARTVKDVISELRDRDRAVILTTHDMNVADELCDRIAFMVGGRIPVTDAPKALKLAYGTPTVRVERRHDGALESREFDLAGLGENGAFRDLLRSGDVETIHTNEATLEDVFIEVTGERLP